MKKTNEGMKCKKKKMTRTLLSKLNFQKKIRSREESPVRQESQCQDPLSQDFTNSMPHDVIDDIEEVDQIPQSPVSTKESLVSTKDSPVSSKDSPVSLKSMMLYHLGLSKLTDVYDLEFIYQLICISAPFDLSPKCLSFTTPAKNIYADGSVLYNLLSIEESRCFGHFIVKTYDIPFFVSSVNREVKTTALLCLPDQTKSCHISFTPTKFLNLIKTDNGLDCKYALILETAELKEPSVLLIK